MDVSPRWTRDGEKIVFARYRDDTNFDGKLTIDDNPNLWSVEFGSMKAGTRRQLTDSSTYDLLPFPAPGDQLFYTSDRGKSIDVWSLPLEGLIPAASGYGSSLQVAEDLCSEEAAWTYRCLAAYGNVIRLFPAEPTLARLRYKVARGSLELGHLKRARLLFAEVIEKHPDRPEYRGLAEIDLFLL
ncbi:MAG: hypothetical protein GWO19_08960, partial [Nitrospinaceae bacterium]|nr:hypothetical protein [Nitrospinaceae bacterium]NIS85140.1 hypothetical protein [Nitrospinaceae bacterium]NIU44219.1 hypothetical protein [Nitrospinaceae bacterium]NIU96340.1 hypothetical protein [Nitrospinaceae bacterium]NIW58985.1 hypothetical protein [Nitrospinaceae bacterium]